MLAFIALCLLSRVAYSFNDVFVGRLARRHSGVEVAVFRGVSLGITMSPLLLWVPAGAWRAFAGQSRDYLVLICVTAGSNLMQLRAARYLPFGLRAALMVTSLALGGLMLGVWWFDERFSLTQLGWCTLIVGSAVVAALGDHSSEELVADVPRGAAFALGSAALMAVAALFFARVARATHPLLAAWSWEFGSGLVLVAPLLWSRRRGGEPDALRRFLRVGSSASPTVVGSAASALALTLGPLGMWSALAGSQALFTAGLGAFWHGERMGARRWLCFALGGVGVFGLALTRP